ncbi:MAG: phage portal protein [Maioricimonas sp. JB049]
MFGYLQDRIATVRLRARYQRLVHERLCRLAEATGPQPVSDDPGRWLLAGDGPTLFSEPERTDARTRARRFVTENPHARNILRLLEAYVTGPGLKLAHQLHPSTTGAAINMDDPDDSLAARADELWTAFLAHNQRHYSFREHARRVWRDGEAFLRRFAGPQWPPGVRFIDPEAIGPTPEHPDSLGILTARDDVETPVAYLLIEPGSGRLRERLDASVVLHARVGVDSNQKRGLTIFAPILDTLECFDQWVETEILARKLQSSIVLWRKIQGSPQQAAAVADGLADGTGNSAGGRRERVQPGTILTTNHATEIQFLQPNTNFGDAVPLGRMLLLATAAGAGLPEFMLTSDASNANFASTMVAEGPAVKQFQAEQQFFAAEFTRLWKWVMSEAVVRRLLPADFFERVEPNWSFPQLVNRDRPRERMADVRLVETGILSRAEIARRAGVDPLLMRSEIDTENTLR